MPDDWDRGVDGVDVVIGARSAVWAPLSRLSAIVVVDEHDESLKEERVPTWHARDVAMRRARYENVPCYLCSPVVSAEAQGFVSRGEAQYASSDSPDGWPVITIADLRDVPVSGSLATSQMLQLVRRQGESVLCILNTKGKARLLACAACRTIARCPRCHAALSSGIGRLREEIEKASGREVVEVDVATDVLDLALHDGVYVGTEALLHRVSGAQHVVFLDFDAEILAPRATATREAVALLIRASRIIGRSGSIVIQTRHIDHDLVVALSQVHHNPAVLDDWHNSDDAMRRLLSLPPYTVLARVRLDNTVAITDVCDESHMTWARESDDTFIVRGRDVALFRESLSRARQEFGQHVRIDIDPVRY
jgi:primosomal protein N' (replication factor Y)